MKYCAPFKGSLAYRIGTLEGFFVIYLQNLPQGQQPFKGSLHIAQEPLKGFLLFINKTHRRACTAVGSATQRPSNVVEIFGM
jgi:hypothetical protein